MSQAHIRCFFLCVLAVVAIITSIVNKAFITVVTKLLKKVEKEEGRNNKQIIFFWRCCQYFNDVVCKIFACSDAVI